LARSISAVRIDLRSTHRLKRRAVVDRLETVIALRADASHSRQQPRAGNLPVGRLSDLFSGDVAVALVRTRGVLRNIPEYVARADIQPPHRVRGYPGRQSG
jgi:hypothetical protein